MDAIDFAALAAPFETTEIEWRVGNRSKAGDKATLLCYLTSRAVQTRLDEVVGPDRWRDSYTPVLEGPKTIGYLCTLEIEVREGQWVGKVDGSDLTDVEALKGGISGALKRAAVKWGVGRYLYGLDSRYHPIVKGYGPDEAIYCPLGDKSPGHILPPKLPDWALPKAKRKPRKGDPIDTTPTAADQAAADEVEAARRQAEAQKAERQAKHHPSWEADRPGYWRLLGADGRDKDVAYELIRLNSQGNKAPSAMDPLGRAKALRWLNSPEGQAAYAALVAEQAQAGGEVQP
jgi:hypothetical protein